MDWQSIPYRAEKVPQELEEYLQSEEPAAETVPKSLIGRFTVKEPTLQELTEWSRENWESNLKNALAFQIIGEGFFKIEFSSQVDYEFVVKNGPWFWGVEGLSLKRWSPDFDAQSPGQLKTPVWIRFSSFHGNISEEMILEIFGPLGKIFKIEFWEWHRFISCRVCVEVDLSKSLPTSIKFLEFGDMREHPLVYEGLPLCTCPEGSCIGGSKKNKIPEPQNEFQGSRCIRTSRIDDNSYWRWNFERIAM